MVSIVTLRSAFRTLRILIVALLLWPSLGWAVQVDEATARLVAQRFLTSTSTTYADLDPAQLQLSAAVGDPAFGERAATVYYRVFSLEGTGFVVVSGDDAVQPILAYSLDQRFTPGELPINVAKWFEGYKVQIRDAVLAEAVADDEVSRVWNDLLEGRTPAPAGDRDVAPLMQTNWNQSPYVNAQCPGGSVTGCVATAMAMVMKYHNHPAQGAGFHSYNAPNYGTLSANFGATTYNWSAMPNTVNSANSAVATLMYHAGVSVDMQYSPQVSGAWVIQANSPTTDHNTEYALKTYFGYSDQMQGLKRENYSQTQWINMLKADLDASRPVIYAGWGTGGGHCFVTDGYDNNDFFHFNWGWGGAYNGFFSINALNPDGTGIGGGTGSYNDGHQALFGIRPATTGGGGGGQDTYDMGLYTWVNPSASTIYYGNAFSVSTNIVNNGSNNFSGDYCAAVFDANDNFYGFVQTLSGYTLQAGYVYNNNLVFSSTGLFSMVPGTYYIGIFYRPTGGEWVLVSDNGYSNFPQVNVINPNDIELNSDMQVSPGNTLTQGGQVSVNLNILNDGFGTFYGQYGVALYNLDGSWAQDIGTVNENSGLPSGYTYLSPFLTFGPTNVTVPPGTYLVAAQHNPNNSGWQLTGSSYFTNPVFVNVVAAGLSPDPYETNNAAPQAHTLPTNFSGNTASTATTGSNLHTATDQDFYKVVLPAGYNYAITARLHDSYNSGNGNSYSVDGMFSWSTDGSTWSPIYDDVMPEGIIVSGGTTVYFHVAPYFTGETGTYLLQLDLLRGTSVGVDESSAWQALRIHPNPAQDRLNVDLASIAGSVKALEILSLEGRCVANPALPAVRDGRLVLDVSTLNEGAYLLRLSTDEGVRTERLIISR
ncbi:MAG TPA: thiol protease/hemagglutinin PrtT [Flavobacteriales bacterium]